MSQNIKRYDTPHLSIDVILSDGGTPTWVEFRQKYGDNIGTGPTVRAYVGRDLGEFLLATFGVTRTAGTFHVNGPVCVGGPYDGKRVPAMIGGGRRSFNVPIPREWMEIEPDPLGGEIPMGEYVLRELHSARTERGPKGVEVDHITEYEMWWWKGPDKNVARRSTNVRPW